MIKNKKYLIIFALLGLALVVGGIAFLCGGGSYHLGVILTLSGILSLAVVMASIIADALDSIWEYERKMREKLTKMYEYIEYTKACEKEKENNNDRT